MNKIKVAHYPTFVSAARTDVPALVKALRRTMGALTEVLNDSYTGSDEEACLHCGSVNTQADHALREITALLNQGRTTQDLGKPRGNP